MRGVTKQYINLAQIRWREKKTFFGANVNPYYLHLLFKGVLDPFLNLGVNF